MGKSLRVSGRSGVGRAVQFAEEFAAQASDGSEARVCPLICEELLVNTPVQENGGNLSGGQRQRISIARALLREPKIILLDEATSALDSISERQVQDAIDAMMGGCTVIMVSHRLSTLRRADTVYRIDRGTLVSYEDLDRVIADME